jgi:ABC-2 type transport system ATP-binding protein
LLEDSVVEVKNLIKIFKGGIRAVDGISFEVKEGEIFGILGPNGAGKSTAIKILTTLISMTSGEVSLLGLRRPEDDGKIREIIGYLPQDISSDSTLTGFENMLLSARLHGLRGKKMVERINSILHDLQLENVKDRLPSTYSGGMIRKLELAQALVHMPKIMFMDEPTVGLDPAARISLWEQIKQLRERQGVTIVMCTHNMEEADSLCDRVAIMNRGKVAVTGAPSALKARAGKGSIIFELQDETKVNIKRMRIKGKFVTILSKTPEADLPRYLNLLVSKGMVVKSAAIKEVTLDDVFLKFTGGRITEDQTGWMGARRTRRIARRLG